MNDNASIRPTEAAEELEKLLSHYEWIREIHGNNRKNVITIHLDDPPRNYRSIIPNSFRGIRIKAEV